MSDTKRCSSYGTAKAAQIAGFAICKTCKSPFLDLHLSISNGFVSSKIYDKRDDFDFGIVNFPFLDGDVSRRPSYGAYTLSNVLTDHLNKLAYIKAWLLLKNKIKLLLLCYTMT